MTTRSGKKYKIIDNRKEVDKEQMGDERQEMESGHEIAVTTATLLELLRSQQDTLSQQQTLTRQQYQHALEQQASQQEALVKLVENQQKQMKEYQEEWKPTSLEQLGELADDYSLARQSEGAKPFGQRATGLKPVDNKPTYNTKAVSSI